MAKNITSFKKGHKGYWLNKTMSDDHKLKISKKMKGQRHFHNKETKIRLSKNHIGLLVGNKHWNWKGGITTQNTKIRTSLEYKLWRKAVFERDRWTCVWCGYKGKDIHADHIKPFALYPELRLALDNGRTLCIPCHKTTLKVK